MLLLGRRRGGRLAVAVGLLPEDRIGVTYKRAAAAVTHLCGEITRTARAFPSNGYPMAPCPHAKQCVVELLVVLDIFRSKQFRRFVE